MKKFMVIFALFCVMVFFAACSNKTTREINEQIPDDSESETDSDVDSSSNDEEISDSSDSADADTDDSDGDADSQPDDDTDPQPDDDTDSQPDDDADTDTEIEPTEAEKCVEAGGTYDYFAEDDLTKCYKTVDCTPKPENTEWRGEQSYNEYYDFDSGTWTHFGQNYSTEYGDTGEQKVCQFICAAGFEWNGLTCQTLPECSASSDTPCKDSSSGLTWSAKASSAMTLSNARSYCESYSEDGLSGWHLPTISELRTLIQNCSGTVTGGSCGITDSCLSYNSCRNDACSGCSSDSTGKYSKFGETGTNSYFWSSSLIPESSKDLVWIVRFSSGFVGFDSLANANVRCVR